MHRWLIVAALGILCGCSEESTAPDMTAAAEPVTLKWLFGAARTADAEEPFVPLRSEHSSLDSGDALHMRLELSEPVHVYVVLEDSAGDVTVLFPRSADELDVSHPLPSVFEILDGVRLDDKPGTETFHLLAARRPLTDLAELVRPTLSGPPLVPVETSVGKALLTRIQRLKKDHLGLATPTTRPVALAGTRRNGDELAEHGTEFTTDTFLYKQFAIAHRS